MYSTSSQQINRRTQKKNSSPDTAQPAISIVQNTTPAGHGTYRSPPGAQNHRFVRKRGCNSIILEKLWFTPAKLIHSGFWRSTQASVFDHSVLLIVFKNLFQKRKEEPPLTANLQPPQKNSEHNSRLSFSL